MMNGQDLRSGMKLVPTAVTIVTASSNGKSRGATIGSFVSVSLEPPLVCFNIAQDAQLYGILQSAEYLAVHVLRDDQHELSNFFASPDRSNEEQFERTPHRIDENGTPILEETLVVFVCKSRSMTEAGDHSVMMAEVISIKNGKSGNPLIFYNRGYHQIGDPATE